MTTFQYTCGAILMAFGSAAAWSGAHASDATSIANGQRVAAIAMAQQNLGYAAVLTDAACCCASFVYGQPDYGPIGRQIEQLSATMQTATPRAEPSAADLAAGAY